MPAGVVLDTSFLITLADSGRPNHRAARSYWRHFVENALPIYLPTIVVSEFYVKQQLPPEILRACVVLPFNWDDATKAASLDVSKVERGSEPRDALKDDVKIIAQAIVKDAAWLITDDQNSMHKFCQRLRENGSSTLQPIKLDGGFDASHFDPQRQYKMPFGEGAGEDEPEE